MGHSHPASDEDGKAGHGLAFEIGNQADILSVDIDAVIARKSDTDLEFAREVGWAIDWLNFLWSFDSVYLFSVNPNFMICPATRSQAHGDLVRNLFYLRLCAAGCRSRTCHDIAVYVTAGCQSGE